MNEPAVWLETEVPPSDGETKARLETQMAVGAILEGKCQPLHRQKKKGKRTHRVAARARRSIEPLSRHRESEVPNFLLQES